MQSMAAPAIAEEETITKRDLLYDLRTGILRYNQYAKDLSDESKDMWKRIIFARYMDCIRAGYDKEAKLLLATSTLAAPQ